MTTKTGTLSMSMGNSRLDGLLLARTGAPNPLTAATSFLSARGFGDNDPVTVTGDDGVVGNVHVFFVTNITAANEATEAISSLDAGAVAPESSANTAKPKKKRKPRGAKGDA